MIKSIHENSLLSYRLLNSNDRSQVVLEPYKHFPDGLTDREVMKVLGFSDMNDVRPRISENLDQYDSKGNLIKEGVLIECGKIFDPITKRKVRVVRLKRQEDYKQRTFL